MKHIYYVCPECYGEKLRGMMTDIDGTNLVSSVCCEECGFEAIGEFDDIDGFCEANPHLTFESNGEWSERAMDMLIFDYEDDKRATLDKISDFVGDHWNPLRPDALNLNAFENSLGK